VRVWRKALGVGATTEGTSRLKAASASASGSIRVAQEKSRDAGRDAGRREKLRAAKVGRPQPRHVVEAMREGRTGKPHDGPTRARMSASHKARGTLVLGTRLWTAGEDEAVRTLPPKEAARRTGRTLEAVYSRRAALGVAGG
jgi:hypothetical protein